MTDVTDRIQKPESRRFRRIPCVTGTHGVEWLGDIPGHWNLKRLKNGVARLESGGTPESGNVRVLDRRRAWHPLGGDLGHDTRLPRSRDGKADYRSGADVEASSNLARRDAPLLNVRVTG